MSAIVICSFSPRFGDELSVVFNELLTIENMDGGAPHWSIVRNSENKVGKVPTNFLKLIPKQFVSVSGRFVKPFLHENETGQFLDDCHEGETVQIICRYSSGWSKGIKNHRVGLFPDSHAVCLRQTTYQDFYNLLSSVTDSSDVLCLDVIELFMNSTPISYNDLVVKHILNLAGNGDIIFPLANRFLCIEVANTIGEGTLFRKNTFCSNLLAQFTRTILSAHTLTYLKPVLLAEFTESAISLEIDPHRLDNNEEQVEENKKLLRQKTQLVLDTIMNASDFIPEQFRKICRLTHDSVALRYPNSAKKSVGAIYFLRYICPAIISPEQLGIEGVNPTGRRGLMLVSKILQTLVNGVKFGVKEPFMACMNEFIDENIEKLDTLISTLIDVDENEPITTSALFPLQEEERNQIFHDLLHISTYDKFVDELNALESQENRTKIAEVLLYQTRKSWQPSEALLLLEEKDTANSATSPREVTAQAATPVNKKAKKKEEKKKLKEEKKPKISPPEGKLLCSSFLNRKQSSVTKPWKRRYFAMYAGSSLIYVYRDYDCMAAADYIGAIELAPSFDVQTQSKSKIGWEFSVRTLTEEAVFVTTVEDDAKQWVSSLDTKKLEILMPDKIRQQRESLLETLNLQLKMKQDELAAIKKRIRTAPEKKDFTRIEELVVGIDSTLNSIGNLKPQIK